MAIRVSPAIEYAFDTRITPITCSGSLYTSQRYESPAITVYYPESTNRTFLSSHLEFTTRDNVTTAASVVGIRMGLKVGSGFGVDVRKSVVSGYGGAFSIQSMAGDGYVEFVAAQTVVDGDVAVGLSTTNADHLLNTINYGIAMYLNDQVSVIENSNIASYTTTYKVGDVFRIQRTGTTIRYYKNGDLMYTSGVSSSGSLFVDTTVYDYTRAANIRFYPAGVETTLTWTGLVNVTTSAASGWMDQDAIFTSANTGDHTADKWIVDVTRIMNTTYSGTSCPAQAAFTMSMSPDGSVTNITCKLVSTYSYEDSAQNIFLKTIRIPIQSHHTTLTTSHVEVGTTGGAAGTDVPSGQIPALNFFLPEAGKTIRQAFLDLYANEATALNTTDFTPYIKIDSSSEVARATLEQALGTNNTWRDIYIYDTGTYSLNTTHTLSARADLTARLSQFGASLNVTYEYNKNLTVASGLVMCEALVPLTVGDTDRRLANEANILAGQTADAEWITAYFDISESNPTIAQSAAFLWIDVSSNGASPRVWVGTQAERTLSGFTSGQGQTPTFIRGDISTGHWTVSQGTNVLPVKSWANLPRCAISGYAIVNYVSSVPTSGPHTVTMPRSKIVASTSDSSTTRTITNEPIACTVSGTTYKVVSVLGEIHMRATNFILSTFMGRLSAGEFMGAGWMPACASYDINSGGSERIMRIGYVPMTRSFNSCNHETGKMSILRGREWWLSSSGQMEAAIAAWTTYNTVECLISGSVSGYTGTGGSISIDVFDPGKKYHTTATTVSGGIYTTTVHDNRSGWWSAARQDSSHVGRSDDGTPTQG